MELGLKGKYVIVSGGSAGIGYGCCEAFAKEGCNVIMNYRHHDELVKEKAAKLAGECNVRVIPVKADVSDEQQVEELYCQLDEMGITADYLVNNAAAKSAKNWSAFEEMSTADWRRQQEGTLNSMFFMTRAFVQRVIKAEKRAAVVNVLSKSCFLSSSVNNSHYASMKGGAAAMTRALAKELIKKGIRVNAVIPGYVKTETSYPDGEPRTEEKRKLLPMGEFAKPLDIGVAAAFLCSDLNWRTINGALFDTTGGTLQ